MLGPIASFTGRAFLEQLLAGVTGRQSAQTGPGADELEDHLVEVVTTEALDAFAEHDLVESTGHLQQRRVERAAVRGRIESDASRRQCVERYSVGVFVSPRRRS